MASASAVYKRITPWQYQVTSSTDTEPVLLVISNRIDWTFVMAQQYVISLTSQKAFLE